ncbi:MAG TPA: AIR synthase-related protein, partial [Ruania sp.]|nr:AIR synthase-related protein [Ruania sp.]
ASGLHSNGYSLVRRVIEVAGWTLERQVDELGRTLGEELLEPTRVYAADCLALARAEQAGVHAFTHVTGGGLAANLARVLPAGLVADVRRDSWVVPPVFDLVRQLGSVPWADLQNTLNLGVGMVAVVAPEGLTATLRTCAERGLPAWELGVIREAAEVPTDSAPVVTGTKGVQGGAVRLLGEYRTS